MQNTEIGRENNLLYSKLNIDITTAMKTKFYIFQFEINSSTFKVHQPDMM